MVKLLFYVCLVFMMNIPFGYWRGNTQKFTLDWILAVHTTVPFIVLMRWEFGYGLVILPISVIAFFSGQLLGAKLRHPIGKVIAEPTSNLFRDVTHFFRRPAFDED
jgi:hypothetical protein